MEKHKYINVFTHRKAVCKRDSTTETTNKVMSRGITVFIDNTTATLNVITAIAEVLEKMGCTVYVSCDPNDNGLKQRMRKSKLYSEVQ